MKQILIKHGELNIEEIPAPVVDEGMVLVEVYYSLISTGTEIFVIKQEEKSLFKKLLKQPEKISKLIRHLNEYGIRKTLATVKEKLGTNIPLGYSCSGRVIALGEGVTDFQIGDYVACAGAGKANHSEVVVVPQNLVVKVPEGCELRDASSVAVGAVALQGIRRCAPDFGEVVAVIGLGLIGLLTVQLLKAAGCRVIGFDVDEERVEKAKLLGADYSFNIHKVNFLDKIKYITDGHGVDATILTAASHDSTVIQQAMEMTRKKGRVIIVGNVNLQIERSPFYEKEIDLLISCSYGPGRYDVNFEERGIDYPYPYVRWTERSNMLEYLKSIADKKVNFSAIVEREYNISQAVEAYEALKSGGKKPICIILSYNTDQKEDKFNSRVKLGSNKVIRDRIGVAVIGAGNFARSVHLPNLMAISHLFHLRAVVDKVGVRAHEVAEQFSAEYCSTNLEDVLVDKNIDMILIATRHNLHASIARAAAEHGKAVFCEKPMALNSEELKNLVTVINKTKVPYMIGFNRRFSPIAEKARAILDQMKTPRVITYRVNAGYLPADSWLLSKEGGGRIVGEACHMFDLFTYLVGSSDVVEISYIKMNPHPENRNYSENVSVGLRFRNNSICNLLYTSIGGYNLPKEYIEIHFTGETLIINDFREIFYYSHKVKKWKFPQNKGHREELIKFADYLKGKTGPPITLDEMLIATKISFVVEKEFQRIQAI